MYSYLKFNIQHFIINPFNLLGMYLDYSIVNINEHLQISVEDFLTQAQLHQHSFLDNLTEGGCYFIENFPGLFTKKFICTTTLQ